MWYIDTPASRTSRSTTSAIVVRSITARAAAAASARTPSASRPNGPSRSSTICRIVTLARLAGERVAALHAALGAQDAAAAQDREELLEELDGDLPPAGEVADRHRGLGAARARELGERLDGVGRLRGDGDHARQSLVRVACTGVASGLSTEGGLSHVRCGRERVCRWAVASRVPRRERGRRGRGPARAGAGGGCGARRRGPEGARPGDAGQASEGLPHARGAARDGGRAGLVAEHRPPGHLDRDRGRRPRLPRRLR